MPATRKSLTDEAIVSATNSLAGQQMEALQQFVRGHDVFVSLPTGSENESRYAIPCYLNSTYVQPPI